MTDPRKQAEQEAAERERLRKLKLKELEDSLKNIHDLNEKLKPYLQVNKWQIFDKDIDKDKSTLRTDLKKKLGEEYRHFKGLQEQYNSMATGFKLSAADTAIVSLATRILAAVGIEQKEQRINKKTEKPKKEQLAPEVKIEVVQGNAYQGDVGKGRLIKPKPADHYGFTQHVTATPTFEKVSVQQAPSEPSSEDNKHSDEAENQRAQREQDIKKQIEKDEELARKFQAEEDSKKYENDEKLAEYLNALELIKLQGFETRENTVYLTKLETELRRNKIDIDAIHTIERGKQVHVKGKEEENVRSKEYGPEPESTRRRPK